MLGKILDLPLFVLLLGIAGVAMLFPALHAAAINDLHVMRVFFYGSILFFILTAFLGIATANHVASHQGRSHLLAILATFIVLPVFLAVPFAVAVRDTTFLNAYFEMVSSITTTGATLYDDPGRLPPSVHLWRAVVAWLGGLFVLVSAIAILSPLGLGGFEVLASGTSKRGGRGHLEKAWASNAPERLQRFAAELFPIYSALTLILWMFLIILGDTPMVALVHAMSTMSTSGISASGGVSGAGSGIPGEAVICLFMIFALSRQSLAADQSGERMTWVFSDPEYRLALVFVVIIPALLFLRHWFGAFEVDMETDAAAGLRALWGGIFAVVSFLTTTGFESSAWQSAQSWSGLETPSVLFMGLALMGGGVATTAGGVKLLRIYALYKHGVREMDKLVHPNSVGGAGSAARRLRRQGAYVAWVFFMLFALSLALVTLGLAIAGSDFDEALTLAIAGLTTTGPIASLGADGGMSYAALSAGGKLVLSAAMVLGRLETLVIIALFNPDFWRR